MRLRNRVERLELRLPAPKSPTPEQLQERRLWRRVARRFKSLLNQAESLLNEAEHAAVAAALELFLSEGTGPLRGWLHDLRHGLCRLPELTPEAMRSLLLAFLNPGRGDSRVCNLCGLESPRPGRGLLSNWVFGTDIRGLAGLASRFSWPPGFDGCPHCPPGSPADFDSPYQAGGTDKPWKALDGWVGARR
jgi:hypothetical protein